jgi:HK97 family phage major capsid protein
MNKLDLALDQSAAELHYARRTLESAIGELQKVADDIEAVDPKVATDADLDELERRFHAAELKVTTAEKDLEAVAETRSAVTRNHQSTDKRKRSTRMHTTVLSDEPIYRADDHQTSFVRDLVAARSGDSNAAERLAQHNAQAVDRRDLSTTATSGGDFTPPFHIITEWQEAARTTRPVADLCVQRELPEYGDSVILPKVTTGGSVAVHNESGNVSETDPVTAEVSSNVVTIGGQIDISRKAFERSAPGLDEVLTRDLLSAFDAELDRQVLYGTGGSGEWTGVVPTAGTTLTYTASTPSFSALLPKLAEALAKVATDRKRPASHWIVHPRRWADILRAVDTSGRPLVTPDGPMANAGTPGAVVAEGNAGTLLGLPVILDANVSVADGSSTNQDQIILVRADDLHLYTRPPVVRVFEETLSGTGTVRLQCWSYAALLLPRADAIVKITGTGLTPPFS